MTPPSTPPRRALNLRLLVVALSVTGVAYVGSLVLYLTGRAGPAAVALSEGAESQVYLIGDLRGRHDAIDAAALLLDEAAQPGAAPRAADLERVRQLAALGSVRSAATPYATVPAHVRYELVRADEAMARLGNVLTETVALLELNRAAAARARLPYVDSVHRVVDAMDSRAARVSREDLLVRQTRLQGVVDEVSLVFAVWVGTGAVLLIATLLAAWWRVAAPLNDLQRGLNRVAAGDLTAQVPARFQDEFGHLAGHFNEMTRVLRNRAEEQGRFAAAGQLLAGVAHEVNNPLMAIAAHAETRLGDHGLTRDQREEMEHILRQARRASKLLRGLLRFVGQEAGRETLVDVNEVARAALDLVSYRFTVDEVTPELHLDPGASRVLADATRLEQVLVNLLSNALDALGTVEPPRRLILKTWEEFGRVSISVADSGRGIPEEFLLELFRPFATTKGRGGTGLGLYISRQILQAAGGDLILASQPGEGARFVASLPAAAPALAHPVDAPSPVPSPPAPAAARSLEGVRILLVDDEEAIRRPMGRFLTRRGAVVLEAGDGVAALAVLEREPVDVIVADLRMPRMDGAELYAALQSTRPALAERMIFLSGDISQLAQQEGLAFPAVRVLIKPVELVKLEEQIRGVGPRVTAA